MQLTLFFYIHKIINIENKNGTIQQAFRFD